MFAFTILWVGLFLGKLKFKISILCLVLYHVLCKLWQIKLNFLKS